MLFQSLISVLLQIPNKGAKMRKEFEVIAQCINSLGYYKESKAEFIVDHGEDKVKKACNQAIYIISTNFQSIAMRNMFVGFKVPSLLNLATYTMGKKELDFEQIDRIVDELEQDLPKIKKFIEILPK